MFKIRYRTNVTNVRLWQYKKVFLTPTIVRVTTRDEIFERTKRKLRKLKRRHLVVSFKRTSKSLYTAYLDYFILQNTHNVRRQKQKTKKTLLIRQLASMSPVTIVDLRRITKNFN